MKKFTLVASLLLAATILTGCNKVKDAVAFTVPLGEQSFKFDLNLEDEVRSLPVEGGAFGGLYVLSLSDAMFSEIKKYTGDKIEFSMKDIEMKIVPATGVEDLWIANLTAVATGVSTTYQRASVPINETFTEQPLATFFNGVFSQVQNGTSVTIAFSGSTNIEDVKKIATVEVTVNLDARVFPLK